MLAGCLRWVNLRGIWVSPRKLFNRVVGWRWPASSSAATHPVTTAEALQQEAEAIHQVDLSGRTGADLYRSLNALNSTALCLSGGGIRSAAFGLGIIQALAQQPRSIHGRAVGSANACLLSQFHYLSTVSAAVISRGCQRAARSLFATIWRYLIGRPDGSDASRRRSPGFDRIATILLPSSAPPRRLRGQWLPVSPQSHSQLAGHRARAVRRNSVAETVDRCAGRVGTSGWRLAVVRRVRSLSPDSRPDFHAGPPPVPPDGVCA